MSSAAEILSGKAKFNDSFCTRIPQDAESCTIDGIVCMQDDRIVCIDNNNLRIKVFNPECRFIFSKELESHCTDLIVVSDIDVATLQNSAIVIFVIGEKEVSKRSKTIQISGRPLAVSYADDKFAVLREQKSKYIEIIERCGKGIQVYSMEQLGKGTVDLVHYIQMDQSGTRFYIIDIAGRINCFNTSGCCLWSTSVPGHPTAGTVLDKVLLFVCNTTHSIVALDDRGIEHKTLVQDKDRIVNCGTIAFQRRCRSILLPMNENMIKFVFYRF